MTSSFGEFLRLTTWGESHGPGIGMVLDGMPPGVPVDLERVTAELHRRRPGGPLASPRQESDTPELLSGVYQGRTLGSPIALWIPNRDARPRDYAPLEKLYRPGHADFTTEARYGLRDPRGGGRASARETAARVAAGALAQQLLDTEHYIDVVGWVDRVAGIPVPVDPETVTREQVDASIVRCPDGAASAAVEECIARMRDEGNSVGGVVGVVARGAPAGWGDPLFAKLEALIGLAMLSIPAAVSVEIGDGLAATERTGSDNNDRFVPGAGGRIETATNRAGGIHGGITSGGSVRVRVGFKPPSTIQRPQETVDREGRPVEFAGTGRHDPCVLPRAVPIVEAMLRLVLADRMLAQRAGPPASAAEAPQGSED